MSRMDIKSLTLDELTQEMKNLNEPSFRAEQIFKWLHVYGVTSFDQMTNVSKKLREVLKKYFFISQIRIEKKYISKYNSTVKYLFKTQDDFIEAVLMKYNHGYSICISTQVGCKMGCSFCATGKGGFVRNLSSSEMLNEIQTAEKDIGVKISHVVLMGMGEPLDNYDNVVKFLRLVTCDDGMNISARHISLSTCGVVDKMYKLADEHMGITLSVSLHAPNDTIRNKIMKINKRFNVDTLLKACDHYTEVTGRRISFEYSLISGVNDSDECARELAKKLSGKICHVNLIPVNPVDETNFKKSSSKQIHRFQKILLDKGINTTIRRTLGSDINASCGQLRHNRLKKEASE